MPRKQTKKRFFTITSIMLTTMIVAVALIALVTYVYWKNFHSLGLSISTETWGQFGDYIGGVLNPALSFISIVLVCITLITTSKQNATQSFESILFELLKLHKENLLNIQVIYSEEKISGSESLEWYEKEIRWNFNNEIDPNLNDAEKMASAIDAIYLKSSNFCHLGHYFRNLYHIFKHIDDSKCITKTEKSKYAKIIRAQLSSIEADSLFFNGLSTKGQAFKLYVERYALLQESSLQERFSKDFQGCETSFFYKNGAFKDGD